MVKPTHCWAWLPAMTLPGYFQDRWQYFAGELYWDVTNTQVNSVLHPPGSLNQVPAPSGIKAGKLLLADGRLHCVIPYGMCFPITMWWLQLWTAISNLIYICTQHDVAKQLSTLQHLTTCHFKTIYSCIKSQNITKKVDRQTESKLSWVQTSDVVCKWQWQTHSWFSRGISWKDLHKSRKHRLFTAHTHRHHHSLQSSCISATYNNNNNDDNEKINIARP